MLTAETWMSAQEVIKMGFTDELIESSIGVAASFSSWSGVVDHVRAGMQQNARLRVTRGQAAGAAKRRYPQLHQRYLDDVNRKALAR